MSAKLINVKSDMASEVRLCNDDFTAIRSLARGRWLQGRDIEWKINRTWLCVRLSCVALDAAFRLVKLGLVENFVCCPACGEVFQLTKAGRERASQIGRVPVSTSLDQASRIEAKATEAGGWLRGLAQIFTKRSIT